jgi:hypothetical protein
VNNNENLIDYLNDILAFYRRNRIKILVLNALFFLLSFSIIFLINKNDKLAKEIKWESEYKSYFFGVHLFENEQWPTLHNYVFDVLNSPPLREKVKSLLRTDETFEDINSLYYVNVERNTVFARLRTLKDNGLEVCEIIIKELNNKISKVSPEIKYDLISEPSRIIKDDDVIEEIISNIKKNNNIKKIYLLIFYCLFGFFVSSLYFFVSERLKGKNIE